MVAKTRNISRVASKLFRSPNCIGVKIKLKNKFKIKGRITIKGIAFVKYL
jgi:hypothetical protein